MRRSVCNAGASNASRSLCVQIWRERSYPQPIYWYHSKGNLLRYNFAAQSIMKLIIMKGYGIMGVLSWGSGYRPNFHIMKLFSRLFVLDCRSRPKYDTSMHFDSPFWGSWGQRRTLVDGSLESPSRVLVKRNWTSFAISYGWGATRQNVSKLAAFRSG